MPNKKKIFFENLDGLRFLCFLTVFLYHSFHTEINNIKNNSIYGFITENVFGNGNLGVNFFFVLSGFLITYLLIEEKKMNKQISIKKFWARRILRIWPLFYACVLFGFYIFPFLKLLFNQIPNETASILHYLTFTNNFDIIQSGLPDASILGVLWSVAIEEQFYFLWPIFLFFIPINRYWILFSLILILNLVFRAFNDSYIIHEMHTISCIGDMTLGSFGAWFIIEKPKFKEKIQNLKRPYISLVYLSFLLIFFFRDEIINTSYYIRIFERLFIAIVILFIILEQCYSDNSFIKMSKFKWISKLGKITYGLYCLHFVGILITLTFTKQLALNQHLWQVLILETLISLGFTILISIISYKFFEKPFLKLKDNFSYFVK